MRNFGSTLVLIAIFAMGMGPILALRAPAAEPTTAPADAPWQSLFDGKTLGKWKPTQFGGEGEVHVEDGTLVIEAGATLSGANYTGETPKMNYEVELDAKRVQGTDFFCGLTVPVGDSFATLICGGWGGTLCGISSLDDNDAARNETSINIGFKKDQWYHIRLRILSNRIMAWIDKQNIIDVDTTDKKISLRDEVEPSKPFGLSTFQTVGAFKNIRLRTLSDKEVAEGKGKK